MIVAVEYATDLEANVKGNLGIIQNALDNHQSALASNLWTTVYKITGRKISGYLEIQKSKSRTGIMTLHHR